MTRKELEQSSQANSDSAGTLVLECLTQHIRCWKCWRVFQVFLKPYDFDPDSLFRCDTCHTLRALREEDYTSVFIRYFRRHTSKKTQDLLDMEVLKKSFRKEFEEKWAEICSCGGRFRDGVKPVLRCPSCNAKTPRWIPWPIDPQVTPPLPVLKYLIPTEYLAYESSLPPEHELPPRKKSPEKNDVLLQWIRPVGGALIILFLYLTLPIVWLSKLLGLLTKEPKKPSKD